MLSSQKKYRAIEFGACSVDVVEQTDGQLVTSTTPLADYPARLMDRLHHWANSKPNTALYCQRDGSGAWKKITYKMALERAQSIGSWLLKQNLSNEAPIMVLSDNDLDHAQLALAAQWIGVPYAPISPAYSLVSKDFDKLKHISRLLTPGLVFAADADRFTNAIIATIPKSTPIVVSKGGQALLEAGYRVIQFDQLVSETPNASQLERAHQQTSADTIVRFLFTSGSTGLPKGVINTNRMVCSNQQMILQCYPFLADTPPVLLDWLPWNHTFGGQHNVGLVLYNGGTLYIDEGKPVPGLIEKTITNLREIAPTIYFNVPKGYEAISQVLAVDRQFCEQFFSRLNLMFYAGASMAQGIWDQLYSSAEQTCGERVVIGTGLGMTESAPSALFTQTHDVASGMLGVPAPGVQIKLVANGEKTELRYAGPNITPGYWRNQAATSAAFDEQGFFITGDAVKYVDPQKPDAGFVFDGRIAEDFKLVTGTWVSVGPLRAKIIATGAPCVQDAVITGIDRSQVGALILPVWDQCKALAGLPKEASNQTVANHPKVTQFFTHLLETIQGQATGSASKISRLSLMIDPPSIDKGEVTDKGSINQRAVLTHRAEHVNSLYVANHLGVISL
jgi:feruloyl-CoA synthase